MSNLEDSINQAYADFYESGDNFANESKLLAAEANDRIIKLEEKKRALDKEIKDRSKEHYKKGLIADKLLKEKQDCSIIIRRSKKNKIYLECGESVRFKERTIYIGSISGKFHKTLSIGSGSWISDKTIVGKNVTIGKNCFIGEHCKLGDDVIIGDNSFVCDFVEIKSKRIMRSNTYISMDISNGIPDTNYTYSMGELTCIITNNDDVFFTSPQLSHHKAYTRKDLYSVISNSQSHGRYEFGLSSSGYRPRRSNQLSDKQRSLEYDLRRIDAWLKAWQELSHLNNDDRIEVSAQLARGL